MDALRPAAEAKDVSLVVEQMEPYLPADFDHDRILQVLANLIAFGFFHERKSCEDEPFQSLNPAIFGTPARMRKLGGVSRPSGRPDS